MYGIKVLVFLFGVSLVKAAGDLSHLCDHLTGLDCKMQYQKGEKDELVCGTDGHTYENFCYYSQARCANRNLDIAFTGDCSAIAVTTTMASGGGSTMPPQGVSTTMGVATIVVTTPAPTTENPLLSTFCQTKNSITCPQDLDPICGSDGKFYLNQCEFSKAYCENASLVSKEISFCTGKK